MGIFDISDKRDLKRFNKVVDKIDDLEPKFEEMSNEELQNMTNVFKERLGKGETLDQILPEAFATVREASKRVLGLKHYRVQLIGGMVLHEGRIAEMKTGEGKTLVATCPVYLNALEGKGVHVITVNDYLAKRDRDQMAQVYEFLGMSVGVVIHGQNPKERRDQYNCDITYGTNNEFGFDYLKDNMVVRREDKVQRELHYAIVDEVDSILIDEARTPLIISGPGNKPASLYLDADVFVRTLNQDDFEKDEKEKAVSLTESGIKKAELYFNVENLADLKNVELNHHINQALKAHVIMKKDIDYVPKDGEIIIVDEFTGRLMMGRRYSEGLHQAIEAKEGLNVQSESTTMATITFQNYFRMYKKLSGMTGTAKTEEDEFKSIYKMDVFQIPTNKPVIRQDLADVVYKDQKSKFNAVVKEITERHAIGQPVLVGTVSINKSEILSNILKDKGIPHNVLNAKFHEQEAEIVAQAGKFGAVTIATNMAGRGTDIVLGGNPAALAIKDMKKMNFTDSLIQRVNFAEEIAGVEDAEELEAARKVYKELLDKYKVETEKEKEKVLEVGGLCIIGTERHDSRRIDNQLRGRAGRQGDPGVSKFFLALDDDLMRLFGTDRLTGMADKLGINDTPIEHRILTKSIENAQKKVEGRNFGIRKSTLEFDDVMNKQRTVIYTERNKVLNGEDVHQDILNMIHKVICDEVDRYYGKIEFPELKLNLYDSFMPPGSLEVKGLSTLNQTELKDALIEIAEKRYEGKEESLTPKYFHDFERTVILESVDKNWIEHIDAMDQLRQFIGLKALGQQDPIIAYKMEGYKMFEEMNNRIKYDVVQTVLSLIITRIS